MYYNLRTPYPNELYHHGIKGQKWGVRRYQNPDGSYTSAGKRRYNIGTARTVKANPYSVTRQYINGAPAGVSAKWYTAEDFRKVDKKDQKYLRKDEAGRNAIASKEYAKNLRGLRKSKEFKEEIKKASLLNKNRVFDEYDKKIASDAIEKASKVSIDDALRANRNRKIKLAAIVAGMLAVQTAAYMGFERAYNRDNAKEEAKKMLTNPPKASSEWDDFIPKSWKF